MYPLKPFTIDFDSIMTQYFNDERTRAFLACNVRKGYRQMMQVLDLVNNVLLKHRLKSFYDPPKFHASFASYPLTGAAAMDKLELCATDTIKLSNDLNLDEPFWVSRLVCKIAQEKYFLDLCG